ncbi:helicase-exonuclease AddAB subunit AddA [Macrococcus armenti]|uniref:helicase-exonuclease AddAB subunit AddA n=1 Tax=Macrococcus armenti TaxID=2875764 RepID=UPI001CCF1F4E|nr:helicase-exonuclease AddAB subunit AddA [Macrococcus armenti]UBH09273.1 helicase-exonuclease AddAB subunit AddA [Macrococcus armenti]
MQWTTSQQEAIETSGQDTLVAAAAGSGKTAVLVERIIRKIIDKRINVDELLVVTFTNASAKEMKHRIQKRLQEALQSNPSDKHLEAQLIKLHQADISTLHRFCLNLIERFYYTINLDPTFRTAGEEERALLLMQAIDDVLEIIYERADEKDMQLLLHLSTDRKDDYVRNTLSKLYHFAIANSEPKAWLCSIAESYATISPESDLFAQINTQINREIAQAIALISQAEVLCISEALETNLTYLQKLRHSLSQYPEQLDEKFLFIQSVDFGRKPNMKKSDDPNDKVLNEGVKAHLTNAKQLITNIKENYLYAPIEELCEDVKAMAQEVKSLTQMTEMVIDTFSNLKRERKLIDFSDYEHFALQILLDDGKPTEIARMLQEQYHEILVDEYQDTNRVQESIIQAIKQPNNMFMVGDVKQSIYKFRQAEPELFLYKYKHFKSGGPGKVIDLSQNFRSRRSVIENTNEIFTKIMDDTLGDIVYDEAQMLYYGAPYDEQPQQTELHFLSKADLEETEDFESHHIVDIIERIIQDEQVYDVKTGMYRRAQYKDIAILERGFSNAAVHMKVLKDRNIPFHVNSKEGYFQTDEINTILSLLRVIDNPLQDIPLAGILRSIIYQFDAHELTTLRTDTDVYLYENLLQYRTFGENEELKQKVNKVLADIHDYRELARTVSVKALIDYIYKDTLLIEKFTLLPGGLQRQANLEGLIGKAEQFEQSSYRGIYQFLRFIDNMIGAGKDFGEMNIVSDEADVVRMMTVHASKGLEFPFVIYSNINRKFNLMETKEQVLLNQRLGLSINYYDKDAHATYPLVMNQLFKTKIRNEQVSEELRLMYVALTRAREKLILIGTVKDKEAVAKLGDINAATKLDDYYRLTAQSPLQLIAPVALYDASIQIRIIDTLNEAEVHKSESENIASSDVAWLESMKQYRYPYRDDNLLPTKESVSEIKKAQESDDERTNWTYINQTRLGKTMYDRPKFMSDEKKTASEYGTLMHKVMQHLPVKAHEDIASIEQFLDDITDRIIITADERLLINVEHIYQFTKSKLFDAMQKADEIYFELPFVIGKQYITESHPEQLVQGMIDCVYKVEGKYYFIDYKTDKVISRLGRSTDETLQELKKRYTVQMHYYKKTLEAILGKPVTGYLYFFEAGTVEVSS